MAPLLSVLEGPALRSFDLTGAHLLMMLVAGFVTVLCIVFHYEAMSWASRKIPSIGLPPRMRIVVFVLVMISAHVVEVWFFALTFWLLEAWPQLGGLEGEFDEGAFDFVYYSATVFTTLGFGDMIPKGPVRILSGTEAVVGLGLITWSASVTFLEMQRDWAEFGTSR